MAPSQLGIASPWLYGYASIGTTPKSVALALLCHPHPPASLNAKGLVEDIELEALPRCPCAAGRFIAGHEHDRSTGYARIAPPERAQPIAMRSHLARWMRSTSPERCAAASRSRLTAPPLWRKQVDPPRILAALHGSPKRFVAMHLGICRFGPLVNRARATMKLSRCVSD